MSDGKTHKSDGQIPFTNVSRGVALRIWANSYASFSYLGIKQYDLIIHRYKEVLNRSTVHFVRYMDGECFAFNFVFTFIWNEFHGDSW